MPNIQSSKKRVATSKRSNLRNSKQKTILKNTLKKFKVAIETNDTDRIEPLFQQSVKLLDKSVTSNIHHKNYANRRKTLVANLYNTHQQ